MRYLILMAALLAACNSGPVAPPPPCVPNTGSQPVMLTAGHTTCIIITYR